MNWIEVLKPVRFDENEVYAICITILAVGVLFYLQIRYKCLYASELMFLWAFDYLFSVVGDYILSLNPFDFYDTFDQGDAELGDILLHIFDYPGVVLIFVCIYVLMRPRGLMKATLAAFGALTGAVIEIIGVRLFNLYLYKDWNIFYSFLFYIPVFYINFIIYDRVHQYILRKKQGFRLY